MFGEQVGHSPLPPALEAVDIPYLQKIQGKVRDVFKIGNGRLALVATDRLSAFDRNVGSIPNRGQVLNQLSAWWFERTRDIIPNHVLEVPDPNVMIVRELERINLEMVVRRFNTGSTSTAIWTRYQNGERKFGGVVLPDGMSKNDPLPHALITPTSKAIHGHDQNLTETEILESGMVTPLEWQALKSTALALFARGQELSQQAGLILVDTKYEFGRDPDTGSIVLIDEIHTPDSSRFWGQAHINNTTDEIQQPPHFDKEYLRLWLADQGYTGDGDLPQLPEDMIQEIRGRYIHTYKMLTGKIFEPAGSDRQAAIATAIYQYVDPFLNRF